MMKLAPYLKFTVSFCIVVIVLYTDGSVAAHRQNDSLLTVQPEDSLQAKPTRSVFQELEHALQTNSAERLTKHFAKKIYLNLRGSKNGYFSANQAHYIVQEFLTEHKLSNLRFSESAADMKDVYITGNASLLIKGKNETVKLYIGFAYENGVYLVSQLTIY